MKLNHFGLIASSEERADKFYIGLLGLEKSERKWVEADLAQRLFNINKQISYIKYFQENICFEIFILPEMEIKPEPRHLCLEVENLENFLSQCLALGVTVKRIAKGDKEVIFISDFDGQLFEIKAAPSSS